MLAEVVTPLSKQVPYSSAGVSLQYFLFEFELHVVLLMWLLLRSIR